MNHFIRFVFSALAVLTCVSLSLVSASAQVDTEFWFVAPEVWANHGDSPTLLRFATFDQDAVVTVEQPANPGFPTQTLNIERQQCFLVEPRSVALDHRKQTGQYGAKFWSPHHIDLSCPSVL